MTISWQYMESIFSSYGIQLKYFSIIGNLAPLEILLYIYVLFLFYVYLLYIEMGINKTLLLLLKSDDKDLRGLAKATLKQLQCLQGILQRK